MIYVLNSLLTGWFNISCIFFLLYLLFIPLTFVVSLIRRILGYDESPLKKTIEQIKTPFVIEDSSSILALLWVYTGLLLLLKWSGLFDNAFNIQF